MGLHSPRTSTSHPRPPWPWWSTRISPFIFIHNEIRIRNHIPPPELKSLDVLPECRARRKITGTGSVCPLHAACVRRMHAWCQPGPRRGGFSGHAFGTSNHSWVTPSSMGSKDVERFGIHGSNPWPRIIYNRNSLPKRMATMEPFKSLASLLKL